MVRRTTLISHPPLYQSINDWLNKQYCLQWPATTITDRFFDWDTVNPIGEEAKTSRCSYTVIVEKQGKDKCITSVLIDYENKGNTCLWKVKTLEVCDELAGVEELHTAHVLRFITFMTRKEGHLAKNISNVALMAVQNDCFDIDGDVVPSRGALVQTLNLNFTASDFRGVQS